MAAMRIHGMAACRRIDRTLCIHSTNGRNLLWLVGSQVSPEGVRFRYSVQSSDGSESCFSTTCVQDCIKTQPGANIARSWFQRHSHRMLSWVYLNGSPQFVNGTSIFFFDETGPKGSSTPDSMSADRKPASPSNPAHSLRGVHRLRRLRTTPQKSSMARHCSIRTVSAIRPCMSQSSN